MRMNVPGAVLATCVACWLGTAAASERSGPPAFAPLRARLQASVRQGRAVSVTIVVARHRRVLWAEGFGWADRERRLKASPDTIYPLGSVSKALTATALMTLVERGQVGLDDPVAPLLRGVVLREGGGRAADLKVRHLLDMTGGIPHLWSYQDPRQRGRDANGELLRRYAFVAWPPGELFSYSNLSYGVLEHVIAAAAREDYATFMRRAVFGPLGLRSASVGRPAGTSRLAAPYDDLGHRAPEYAFEPRAGAGLYASARDLVAFASLHLKLTREGSALLRSESLDLLHTPLLPSGTAGSWYMAGWGRLLLPGGPTLLVANGAILGAAATVLLVPESGLAVVCLTNTTTGEDFTDGLAVAAAEVLVPGLESRFRAFMEDWSARYSPRDFRADPRFQGAWDGAIQAAGAAVDVGLEFSPDGGIRLGVGGAEPTEVGAARIDGDLLTLNVAGALPWPEMQAAQRLELALHPDDGALVGVARAVSGGKGPGFGLPAFVRLTRRARESP